MCMCVTFYVVFDSSSKDGLELTSLKPCRCDERKDDSRFPQPAMRAELNCAVINHNVFFELIMHGSLCI